MAPAVGRPPATTAAFAEELITLPRAETSASRSSSGCLTARPAASPIAPTMASAAANEAAPVRSPAT
eukprot:5816986-Pleurochrysis_carterae.AAC.1